MANESVSIEQVKSIVNGLEISPSKHDSNGHAGGKPTTVIGGMAGPGKTALSTTTSEFKGKP